MHSGWEAKAARSSRDTPEPELCQRLEAGTGDLGDLVELHPLGKSPQLSSGLTLLL